MTSTVATRLGPIVVMHDKASAAGPGAMLDVTDAVQAMIEISGTFTGLGVDFEGSIDGGTTWFSVSLIPVANTTFTNRVGGASTPGLYLLEFARPLSRLRARATTGATPTGAMTVRGRAALV